MKMKEEEKSPGQNENWVKMTKTERREEAPLSIKRYHVIGDRVQIPDSHC